MIDRTDNIGIPAPHLFRQANPGDWISVVAKMKRELKAGNLLSSNP